jgi:hypothetical protein
MRNAVGVKQPHTLHTGERRDVVEQLADVHGGSGQNGVQALRDVGQGGARSGLDRHGPAFARHAQCVHAAVQFRFAQCAEAQVETEFGGEVKNPRSGAIQRSGRIAAAEQQGAVSITLRETADTGDA